MKDLNTIILLILGTIFFGLVNVLFHFWTDWNLGLYLGQLYDVDFDYWPSKYPDFIVLSSLYGGPRLGGITLIQMLIVMLLAGYFMMILMIGLIKKRKITKLTLIMTLLFWIVKIPVPAKYSNLEAILAGLIAW